MSEMIELRAALNVLDAGDLNDLGGLASEYPAVYKMHRVYHAARAVDKATIEERLLALHDDLAKASRGGKNPELAEAKRLVYAALAEVQAWSDAIARPVSPHPRRPSDER